MARILLDDPAHAGGSDQLFLGTVTDDNTGDTLRAGGAKLKQWAADLNSMTSELYGDIGGLAPSATTDTTNASNISSGTLPAGRMPAHTGDVTTVAGAVATTIAANAVTNAKAAQMPANTIKGNNTAGVANAADLTTAQTKALLAITSSDVSGLAASATTDTTNAANISSGALPAGRLPALTGDVTTSVGTVATTVAAGAVTLAKMANLAANSILGNNTGSPATPIALTAAQVNTLLGSAGGGTFAAGNTGTAPVPNMANGAIQTWTQNGNVTWGAPTNVPQVGQQLTLVVTQDATGGYSTAWNPIYKNVPKTPAASVANAKSTYVFIWNGTYWSIPDNYANTPFPFGAVGDGTTNDTVAVQAAANSGYCLLPAGFTFLVTSPITVPNNGTFIGEGVGVSFIKASSVAGAVVQTVTFGSYVTIGNFHIYGTAKHGCTFAANNSRYFNILLALVGGTNATFSFNGFNLDNAPFGCTFDNLSCDSAICGSTLTLSASVGGATSGTIFSGTNPGNGAYIMQFSNGEIRKVTISGSGVSWSTALAAGTITTVSYGASFFMGGGFNANVCNMLYTGQSGQPGPFNFLLDDVNAHGTSQASTFNTLCAQNGAVGLFIGENHYAHTFNAYYAEDVVAPVIIGNRGSSLLPLAITINGANLGGPAAAHPQYANRRAFIDLANTSGVKIINPLFQPGDTKAFNAYPLTFTGGTATSAATAYAFANAAGVIKGVSILDCGNYSVAPTGATIGTPGSGATFTVTTGSSPFGHTGVLSVTVTAGGSGYTAHTGMVPVLMGRTGQVCIDTPMYQWSLDANVNGISPILAYDSVNQASNDYGITILNDNGLREFAGARTNGVACYKPAEFSYRQFLQIPTTGAMASFAVPIALYP